MRTIAYLLGAAGLLPFVGLSLAAWLAPLSWHAPLLTALIGYAAIVVSFLGGIHWGVALNNPDVAKRHLWWGVAPALLAWGSVLLPFAELSLSALIVIQLWSWWIDRAWLTARVRGVRYLLMRTLLTAVASLALLAAIASFWRLGLPSAGL